jgi:hypothetical protein
VVFHAASVAVQAGAPVLPEVRDLVRAAGWLSAGAACGRSP